ncbi:MAG: hypothetical protein ACLP19_26060 [Xanthobacteraceae bacterium]
MKTMWFGILLAGCVSGPLAAQTDVASDQELFAAYCLGREQQGQKDWGLLGIASINETLASVDETMQRDFTYQIEHLQDYLRAHGLGITGLRSVLANAGVSNAILRGRADEASCGATTQNCVKACTKPKPVGYDKECTDSCGNENPACQSASRCYEELRLPP